MNIQCELCDNAFLVTSELSSQISQSINAEEEFTKINCPKCSMQFLYEIKIHPSDTTAPQYRCPSDGCTGWVDWINDEYWGCGQCGEARTDIELIEAISVIISKYTYRVGCYKQINFGFLPLHSS